MRRALVARSGTTVRLSENGDGVEGNGLSNQARISGDGRFVVFTSAANNLVANDVNGVPDIFMHDLQSGVLGRVVGDDGSNRNAMISRDGRYVAFQSDGAVARGVLLSAVYLLDRTSGTTTKISVSDAGVDADDSATVQGLSDDGGFVSFVSRASNLVDGDLNNTIDVFVRDVAAGTTARESLSELGAELPGNNTRASLSGDGSLVVFQTAWGEVVTGDTNGALDVFLRDRSAGTTTLLSVALDGGPTDGDSVNAAFAPNGRHVAVQSEASNLGETLVNGLADIFVLPTE